MLAPGRRACSISRIRASRFFTSPVQALLQSRTILLAMSTLERPVRLEEMIGGQLFFTSRPVRQLLAVSRLGGALSVLDGESWFILNWPELHFGNDVLVPDLAGWRRDRMSKMPDVEFFTQAPDWICEVASPETHRLDRAFKMPAYARAGVSHLWMLEPNDKLVEMYQLEGPRWRMSGAYEGSAKVRAEPFAAIEIDLARFWLED
jgi:Uma2 family endonuclease